MKPQFLASFLVIALSLTPATPMQAQDLDRAFGALLGAIIGGAIQERQQRRPQTTQPRQQRTQPARPAISQAQRQQTRNIQAALNFFGFSAGTVDGLMGPNTRRAISAFQQNMGYRVTGNLANTQRDFLLASHSRARSASPQEHRILQQQGPQKLLLAYRDELQTANRAQVPQQSGSASFFDAQDDFRVPERITPERAEKTDIERPRFGPLAVVGERRELNRCFQSDAESAWRECMRRQGVSSEAIAFSEALEQKRIAGYLTGLLLRGEVDIGQVFLPRQANTNEQYVFLSGQDGILESHVLMARQPPSDAASMALRRRFPNAMATGRLFPIGYRDLPDGGQRFVFTDVVTDGCRGCAVVGQAIIHFDFRNGVFQNAETVGWTPFTDYDARPSAQFAQSREIAQRIANGNVREMQLQLNLKGFRAGSMDGVSGSQTRNALSEFLAENCQPGAESFTAEGLNLLALQYADVQMTSNPEAHPEADAALLALEAMHQTLQACGAGPSQRVAVGSDTSAEDRSDVLPLRDGVYARSARYCRPEEFDAIDYGDGIASVRRLFEQGVMHYYESACRADKATEMNGRIRVRYTCSGEGDMWTRDALFENISETSFIEVSENIAARDQAADFVFSKVLGNVGYQNFQHCDVLTSEDELVKEQNDEIAYDPLNSLQLASGHEGSSTVSIDQLRFAAGFLDPRHTERDGKKLLGLDLRSEPGTTVLAPISGMIIGNRTGSEITAAEKWLIVRDTVSGQEHVFGHVQSPLKPGDKIGEGEPLGIIAGDIDEGRLHWGINRYGIWQAVDTAAGWSWTHGPGGATADEAQTRGWIDPAALFSVVASEAVLASEANEPLVTRHSGEEVSSDSAPTTHNAEPGSEEIDAIDESSSKSAASTESEDVPDARAEQEDTADALALIEDHFTAALGVDSDYVQLQLIDAGFYTGDLAPFGPDGRHSQWKPEVRNAFQAALDYARAEGIAYDLSSENGYYAFVANVRAHRLAAGFDVGEEL